MEPWLSTVILGFMTGALAFFMKKQLGDIEKNIEKNHRDSLASYKTLNDRVDKLEQKLADTIANLPHTYTLRDDFIRAMSGVEAKLNKILDRLPPKGEC